MHQSNSATDGAFKKDVRNAVGDIVDHLHSCGVNVYERVVILISYLLYISCCDSTTDYRQIIGSTRIPNNEVKNAIESEIDITLWNNLSVLAGRYNSEIYKYIALMPNAVNVGTPSKLDDMTTPASLVTLANALLRIQPQCNVADIGCGEGTYLVSSALNETEAYYWGYEINQSIGAIASIRASLLNAEVQVKQCDAFSLLEKTEHALMPVERFDCIFANYPFAMRMRNYTGIPGVQKLISKYPGLAKATSADWLFHALISELLCTNGRAVCITTNGSTWNTNDAEIRKQFVEEGRIEAIIALPERMFSTTSIPTSMLVLSHGNKTVRLIDATELYAKGRRINSFNAEHYEMILDALEKDSSIGRTVSLEDIRKNDYVLHPARYMDEVTSFIDGVPFESIIKGITRGAPYTASQLDRIISHTPTNMQYLMLANIQNGLIESDLPYLTEIDPKYDKYCVHTGTLILSKNGMPYKVAVAHVEEGKRILANGNLYIIDLDEEKADPYYVKAFLESEQGSAQLASITVGSALPNIGIDKLKKITIPLPCMEKQRSIAQAYRGVLDEIAILKKRLEETQNKLTQVFEQRS